MREQLKFAVMECGELFMLQTGTAVMLLLSVDNWDFTNLIQVCLTITVTNIIFIKHYSIYYQELKFSSIVTSELGQGPFYI